MGSVENAGSVISALHRGEKRLVFVESRARAERVSQALGTAGLEVFVHHSSVSRADRELAEAQFARGQNTAIVCTSTMELGIDVGDLDLVVQVDAPGSVASFLQRIGRTGRRAGTVQRCAVFCLTSESLLQSLAVLRLAESGWVEEIRPAAHAMHILAHQVMALSLQDGGVSRRRVLERVQDAYPFTSVRDVHVQALLETMVAREILYEADGLLSLGRRGEQLYGRMNFFELYGVFTAPPMLRVMNGKDEVGYVQAAFVWMHDGGKGPLCFRLAGRAWEVVQIEWSRGILRVRSADRGRVPNWVGMPGLLSQEICQMMMQVLGEDAGEARWLSGAAAGELRLLREGYAGLLEDGAAPLEELADQEDGVQWHTFAGGRVNRLLAAGLEKETGKRWTAGNLSLRCKELGLVAARAALAEIIQGALDWEALAVSAARGMTRGMVSKFQPCLPEAAEDRMLAERLLDLPGTLRFLGQVSVREGRGTPGRRLNEATANGELAVTVTLPRMAETGRLAVEKEIRWVAAPAALRAMVEEVQKERVIGLDVETALDFGTLCLVQIATAQRTFLVDPFAVGSLEPLAAVLGVERPIKVIHHAVFERRVLGMVGLELRGVCDTLVLSRALRGRQALGGHSLAMVCERELGLGLDKTQQTSNWSRRPLDADQLRYAALDAEVLLRLHNHFLGETTTQS